MGMREWYWGSGKSSKRGRGGGGAAPAEKDLTTSSGCMCAVFQLFDFPQLQLANLHHQQQTSFSPEDLTVPKGVEAPRNSLDSSEGTSLSTIAKEEENLNSPLLKFQMGMQIKTTKARTSSADFSSDMNSPGTKTPSLVARLMGLDILPDQTHSPSSTSSSTTTIHTTSKSKSRTRQPLQSRPKRHVVDMNANGTRSLPETPRISSARRSDVDLHHRLSLQINKENNGVGEELDFSYKRRDMKIHIGDHESVKSPSHYARQIVKQVRESVSRKVGLDITNTTRSVNRDKQGRDEILQQLKSKNANAAAAASKGFSKEESAAACSPRLRFLESKATTTTPSPLASTKDHTQVLPPKPKSPLSSLPVKPKALQPLKEEQQQKRRQKSAHVHDIGYSPRLKNKQPEEAFVSPSTATRAVNNNHNINPADKKCKKTQLLSSSNVPTLLPIKKDPSPPATKIPHKQVQHQQGLSDAQQSKRRWSQLSSSTSQTYKQQQQVTRTPHVHALATRDINFNGDMPGGTTTTRSTTAAGGAEAELHQYVQRMLSRTGIDKKTLVSFTNWFSPSHPLDPSIFYHLESSIITTSATKEFSSQLGQRCNRKLIFQLVDEILVEILRPYINMKPWVTSSSCIWSSCNIGTYINGSQLINTVCYKIQKFPCADCQVLEDIDALIDKDMPESKVQSGMAFEEEGEGIVREVEKDILDTLIHETAMSLWF